jgi:toxin-antitoxin system PIN domain toxin
MPSWADGAHLPDVNVWIAMVSDRHEHHLPARQWFESTSARAAFCRVTQMGLLRLLTNRKVMGDDTLTPAQAVATYGRLASDERIYFVPEPSGLEEAWISLMNLPAASSTGWTDAYLAAFAMKGGLRLVTFDKGMSTWPALDLTVLSR